MSYFTLCVECYKYFALSQGKSDIVPRCYFDNPKRNGRYLLMQVESVLLAFSSNTPFSISFSKNNSNIAIIRADLVTYNS